MDSSLMQTQTSATSLPNRVEFAEQTEQLLEFSARTQAKAVMLFITFDSLVDDINQRQNNLAIKAISKRLLTNARESDIYAHLDDMNFANLSIATSEQHAPILVEKLKNQLAEPITLEDGLMIRLNAKVGAALFPEHGSDYQSLLDKAMQSLHG
ncbi:MAG: diguanylate cyclase [Cycloclasticus sp.]|nr:diguanylate cyclase [Cycloclasticus sp.]